MNLDDLDEVLVRGRTPGPVTLVAYDPQWPARFAARAAAIQDALGERVRVLEHVLARSD